MRRFILWFHRWTGILLAVYLVVIGITGGALVFHDEAAALSRVPQVTGGSEPWMDVDTVAANIRAAFPDMHLHTLYWPANSQSPWFAEIKKGEIGYLGENAYAVYLHPTTGKILHVHNYGTSVWRVFQVIHINLISGRTGRAINSMIAVAALFSLITGLVVWWPRRLGKALWSINWSAGPKRLLWELHQVSGIYSLAFLLLLCATGAYFGWRGPINRSIGKVFPMAFLNKALRPVGTVDEKSYRPVSSFLASVREQVPNYPVTRVLFPEAANQPIRFVVYEGSRDQFYKASSLFYHPATGELLRADLVKDELIGDRIVNLIAQAHFGAFGSILVKCLWAIGALFFPIMAVTGVWVYVNKTAARLRANGRSPVAAEPSANIEEGVENQEWKPTAR